LESVSATNQPQDKTTVLQTKLHKAAKADKARCFHALHDKVYLPYILQSAWELVRKNDGAAGIDGQSLADIETYGVERFLMETAQAVREKTYRPVPVRRVNIPKGDGRFRPLGIPTVRDRVVQAAAKLVLVVLSASVPGSVSMMHWHWLRSTPSRGSDGWWMRTSSSSSTTWIIRS